MLRLSLILGSAALVTALVLAGVYTSTAPVANPGETAEAAVPSGSAAATPPAAAPVAAPAAAGSAAAASGAEPLALSVPQAALEARGSDLAKLIFSAPRDVPQTLFTDAAGKEQSLADYKGKWLLVNFWAVWCVPCRVEMPALDALEGALGGEKFAVLTVASGRNEPAQVERFYEQNGLSHLPKLFDPKMALAAQMGVPALPVSVIIDPEGREVGRLIGDAEWNSGAAHAVIRALLDS